MDTTTQPLQSLYAFMLQPDFREEMLCRQIAALSPKADRSDLLEREVPEMLGRLREMLYATKQRGRPVRASEVATARKFIEDEYKKLFPNSELPDLAPKV